MIYTLLILGGMPPVNDLAEELQKGDPVGESCECKEDDSDAGN